MSKFIKFNFQVSFTHTTNFLYQIINVGACGIIDMYMSYRWVSFWWKVTWQRHTESETWPSEIKSSITKTMLRHNEITHNAYPAMRISLYDNSHRSHSNWNEGRQYLSKISYCPSQCCAWRGTV